MQYEEGDFNENMYVDNSGVTHIFGKKKKIKRSSIQKPKNVTQEQLYEDTLKAEQLRQIHLYYAQADPILRNRIRSAIKLREYTPEDLAEIYTNSPYHREVIKDFMSYFTSSQKYAIDKVLKEKYNF